MTVALGTQSTLARLSRGLFSFKEMGWDKYMLTNEEAKKNKMKEHKEVHPQRGNVTGITI